MEDDPVGIAEVEPVGAVGGYFPNLPPTPAPLGAWASVPDRSMTKGGYQSRMRGSMAPYATRPGVR
jgi:hypothetical protein